MTYCPTHNRPLLVTNRKTQTCLDCRLEARRKRWLPADSEERRHAKRKEYNARAYGKRRGKE